MAIIAVSRVDLENNDLMRLVVESNQYHDPITEQYYWSIDSHSAMICMLAGIGTLLGDRDIDSH